MSATQSAGPQLSASDQQLMGDFCVLAARLAVNGVYMAQMYSRRLGAPVLAIVAIGEQAEALQSIVMQAAVGNEAGMIERVKEHQPGF